jgi:hypothetical protein
MKRIGNIILFLIIICATYINLSFAEINGRWWNKEEISALNVAKDFKTSRLGRDYYIDGINGDDERGDGSILAPWKTIGKAFDYYAGRPTPGDAVRIKAGVYRERIEIRSSGTPENHILVGPYGDGEVVIDASNKVAGWNIYKDKIYKAKCLLKPSAVVLDQEPLFPEFSLEKINKGKWYYDNKNKIIYVYIPDGKNPESHDIGIVNDDEYQIGIFLNGAQCITIYGLTVEYTGGHGISVLGNNNRIEKCNIKFNGKGGISIWSYGNTISTDNLVIKNHIYHNMLRNWPRGRYKWGLWTAGGSTGAPNTQFVGNVVHKNGGEGLLSGGQKGSTIFRDNIVYDNWSVNIYIDGQPDCMIEKNFIFCHEPNLQDLYNNGDDNPSDNKNLRRLRAEGIMTADEGSPATFRNAKIVNNVIIGCRRGITHYGKAKGSALKDVLIANNTIIVPNAKGPGEEFVGINIPYNNGNNSNVILSNNIIYGSHPSTYLLFLDTGLSLGNDNFRGLTFRNNLWYHASNPKPFHIGPRWVNIYHLNFKEWQNKCRNKNQCSGEINKDPKFFDVGRYSVDGLTPKPDSPVIDAGIFIEGITGDYNNNPRKDRPDIGAIECIKNE